MPKRICIDPGHGGVDSGCVAYDGSITEEDINLRVALQVRDLLEERRHEVIMTRTDDVGVSLRERGCLSVRKGADIFLSIHHDAAGRQSARGCSAFYWSEHCPNGKHLATTVSKAIAHEWGLPFAYGPPARVHWVRLGVLRGCKNWYHTTAALCECCFLTNAEDLALVKRGDYVERTAAAIVLGIQKHIATEWPEDDTLAGNDDPIAEDREWRFEVWHEGPYILGKGRGTTWTGDNTRTGVPANDEVIACSLPRGLCERTAGSPFTGVEDFTIVVVYLERTHGMIYAPVIDERPAWMAEAGTGEPGSAMIDLTPAAWRALGGEPMRNEEVAIRVLKGSEQIGETWARNKLSHS